MEVRNWHVKDIYFNECERDNAVSHVERMKKSGWRLESEDMGSDEYDYCFQMMKDGK